MTTVAHAPALKTVLLPLEQHRYRVTPSAPAEPVVVCDPAVRTVVKNSTPYRDTDVNVRPIAVSSAWTRALSAGPAPPFVLLSNENFPHLRGWRRSSH